MLKNEQHEKKVLAKRSRYARVYKGIAVATVTFFGEGEAAQSADFFCKKKSEQAKPTPMWSG